VNKTPDNDDDLSLLLHTNHFLVLDNSDDVNKKIRDLISISSTSGNFTRRKLYSDSELETRNVGCFLSINSRNNKLLKRDDLSDRSLIIKVKRLDEKDSTSNHYEKIKSNRNIL
jgi:hypothetical protein